MDYLQELGNLSNTESIAALLVGGGLTLFCIWFAVKIFLVRYGKRNRKM